MHRSLSAAGTGPSHDSTLGANVPACENTGVCVLLTLMTSCGREDDCGDWVALYLVPCSNGTAGTLRAPATLHDVVGQFKLQ